MSLCSITVQLNKQHHIARQNRVIEQAVLNNQGENYVIEQALVILQPLLSNLLKKKITSTMSQNLKMRLHPWFSDGAPLYMAIRAARPSPRPGPPWPVFYGPCLARPSCSVGRAGLAHGLPWWPRHEPTGHFRAGPAQLSPAQQ